MSRTKRILFGVTLLALFGAAIALGFAEKRLLTRSDQTAVPNKSTAQNSEGANPHASPQLNVVKPALQSGGQFDLTRNVIAGGGGTSSGGNIQVDGTVGEVSASNTQSGGQFSLQGGFWATLPTATSSP